MKSNQKLTCPRRKGTATAPEPKAAASYRPATILVVVMVVIPMMVVGVIVPLNGDEARRGGGWLQGVDFVICCVVARN